MAIDPVSFSLVFKHQSEQPTEHGDYLIYNQCDGYHLVEARFMPDGSFLGFYDWCGMDPYPDDFYVAWAILPASATGGLYERFADKPRDGLSAHEVGQRRLVAQREEASSAL